MTLDSINGPIRLIPLSTKGCPYVGSSLFAIPEFSTNWRQLFGQQLSAALEGTVSIEDALANSQA